ncbi:unnamed protein product [Brassicogethes aeneus]|uniref:Ig-like domain-containing protein n=1 Tax=Brassicogethes aeneus TaxID=1431903 RepID=A0A9P0AW07_BRAAE|nr:unnamed protein product [Brassicogethes aeneus]
MYTPICRSEQKKIYGVARRETAKVLCEVESYPPPDTFEWSFNNSAETINVPDSRYMPGEHNFSSSLTYTPVTELDYGTVMCWANNLAGRQQDPCVFHIIAAGKPDSPFNCTVVNTTIESLEVECMDGFNGGLPQFFLLEVYDWKTGTLQANVSAKFPLFIVSGLDAGKVLKMEVYAANSKGRSESVLLEGFTLKAAEKQTALLLVTLLILAAIKIRAARRDGSRALRPGFLPVKEKATLPLRSESEDLFEKDDKNPDVIPSNKDSDYQLGSAVQTPGLNNSTTGEAEYEQPSPHQQQQNVPSEVTYAELALARPSSLDALKNGAAVQFGTLRGRKTDDPTIYAQIDHNRRPPPPPIPAKASPPMVSPVANLFPTAKQGLYHREVVTVRTPLMGCTQESCV